MTELDKCLKEYEEAVSMRGRKWNNYTEFEVIKLELADRLLTLLGLPTSPPERYQEPNPVKEVKVVIGFVYLIQNKRNGYTKIGFSRNPEAREKTLQSEEPELEMLAAWPASMATEYALHSRFKQKRLRGEWFDLTEEDRMVIQEELSRVR